MNTLKTLLQQSKIDALDAEIICAEVLKKPRAHILAHPELTVPKTQERKILSLFARRAIGEPLAYLVGHKEFCGLEFFVDKRVLVPRPETELLVETAIDILKIKCQKSKMRTTVIDIGTGSGCVPIAIVKNVIDSSTTLRSACLPAGKAQNDIEIIATDISADALTVAKKNAKRHGVKIKFLHGDLLAPFAKYLASHTLHLTPYTSHLIITANLPYGWKAWKNNCSMETRGLKFEPSIALYTGKDGLELYEKLFIQIHSLSKTFNLAPVILLIEFDPRQTHLLKNLIQKHLPKASVVIKKDLAGHDRLAIITLSLL